MSRSLRIQLTVVALGAWIAILFTAGFAAQLVWLDGNATEDPLGPFWDVWDIVEENVYGEVPPPRERTVGAIRGVIELLDDPYTTFVEPQPRELERDRLRGSFGGIGVEVYRDTLGRMTLSPYEDSPALHAGLRAGDVLLAIDGEPITDETTLGDVRATLHGERGTSVTLTVARPPGDPFDVQIERQQIDVPSVTWRVLPEYPDIGYIHVQSFTERTPDESAQAVAELSDRTTTLVLDLRDNYGGLTRSAVDVASLFIPEGSTVYYEVAQDGEEKAFNAGAHPIQMLDRPMVVLVNEGTASAAEIVVGALQAHGRARLLGERTFGKGSVQLLFELSDGSSLHVTNAIWLTPDRKPIGEDGLTPDVPVTGDSTADEQLYEAVALLQREK